jgi:hypothetical protein
MSSVEVRPGVFVQESSTSVFVSVGESGPEGKAFASGARSSEEKPRYDLIPVEALRREAIRMAEGARAHGVNNYRVGVHDPAFITDRINHLIEHAVKYASGDRSDDHLAAVRANAGMLIWLEWFTEHQAE